jgi:CHAT domain-containing protein
MLIPPPAALALASALSATPPVAIPREGGRAPFVLSPMQWRRHEIALTAGQFVQVTLHQRGLDAMLRLVGPDGRVIEDQVDSSEGESGMEPASMLATVAGTYAVEVWAPGDLPAPGGYEIESAPPRAPGERDRLRLRAETLMAAAGRVMGPRATRIRRGRSDAARVLKAIAAYEQVAPLWAALGETCWQAEATTCLGINHYWYNHSVESGDALFEAADLWDTCGDQHKFIENVLYVGRRFVALSRFPEAAETYEFGLRLAEERGDAVLRLQFLVQLTQTYGQMGDTELALRHGETALPILRALGYGQGVAMTLMHLANAHYRRGELQQASEALLESLPLQWEEGEVGGGAATLVALGDVYEALGEPDLALGYLQELVTRIGHYRSRELTEARSRLAAIYARTGRLDRAFAELEHGVQDARYVYSLRAEATVRLQRARLLVETGAWEEARSDVEEVLAASERSGDRFALAEAQELVGQVQLRHGDGEAARDAFAESLALRRAIGDRAGEASILQRQARLARAEGDLDGARALLETARSVVAAQRGLLATPQLRATWSSTVRGIDEAYVGVLSDLHRLRPREGFDALAFEAGESASARSLLDALAEPRDTSDAATSALSARERSVRGRLTMALDRQVRARAAGDAQPALDVLTQEVRELSAEHERVRAEWRAADPRSAALARPEPLRLPDVQSLVLDADTTLVEFFLGDERGFAWVVGRDRLQSYELPARTQIDAAVEAARRALAAPPTTADRASRALRDLADLVLPADRGWLRGRRLVVVADGSLHYVPFAALPDATGQPLVARLEIANAPSASVALQLRRALAERTPAPRAIVAIADPVYDGRDLRLSGGASGRVADATLVRATRDFGFQDGRLPRLPFTRREALAITALAPATSTAALDFRANLETALAPDLASYRYVHFAAHGLLNDVRPDLSGLVLSLVDGKGEPRPGLLTAPDVSSLRLGAELVVLSSCRSAAGREVRGEGLVGLARAFMCAGAPRVVASLWPVDDVASSELMARMYRGMLGPERASPAAALREAQLQILRSRKWKAPYYWAGFQLQGEWR